jgi:CBS domain-containing protein
MGRAGGVVSRKDLIGRSLRTCHPDDTLSVAAQIMLEEDTGCLLVRARGAGDRMAGLITDRDICMAAHRHAKDLGALRVEDAMSTEVAGFGVPEALAAAGVVAAHGEVRPLALLDEQGELLAIVSLVPFGGGGRFVLRGGESGEDLQ